MRVRNVHTASVDGIAPGAEGEVNASNPGIRALLGTFLLPVDADVSSELFARVEGRGPTVEDGVAMVAEIARLTADLDAARTRITDLERELAQARADLDAATAPPSSVSAPPSSVSAPTPQTTPDAAPRAPRTRREN